MAKDMLNWLFGKDKSGGARQAPAYEKAREIAATGSEKERTKLARFEDLDPEFLYYFATDESADVRHAVAGNEGTPLQADRLLAEDKNDRVRIELAGKIGKLIPGLSKLENAKVTDMAVEVLEILARDELPKVRAIIAEETKHLDYVPKEMIALLARDAEESVSVPILEFSSLLNESELIQIIAGGIKGGALEAIARRKKVSEPISDAVVETGEVSAMIALLKNYSAEIGEKTMAAIGSAAMDVKEMHAPLVDRSNLSVSTMRRIASFVSASLVEKLIKKHKLGEDVEQELRYRARQRIDSGDIPDVEGDRLPADERAEVMHKKGQLTEKAIQKAIEDGDIALVPHALKFLTEMRITNVKAMLASDNGKAVASIVWKAGFSMETAMMIQRRVARVQPKNMAHENEGGGFPLTDDEMLWYLESYS
ncbi:MAG: DUF2336 domain-containing protein [Rhodospirillaceae bacterium]|jgi:uncharacterized protein (DUF2336 family)|nr:DUF2336 domain-containing protein [Rhodospirillaceae bacterium]